MSKDKKTRKSGPERRNAAGVANITAWRGKARLSHGISACIASNGSVMPPVPGADLIKSEVDDLISEAISDIGGESALTAQRKVILESERLALLVLKLAGAYLAREGLLNRKTGKPHAVLNIAASYANSARLSALALGLERRPRKIGPASLDEYLEQREQIEQETPAESEAVEVPEPER